MNIRIKKIRQTLKISQTEYAELTHTSQSNISKYERNELKPTIDFLINLHERLNVNINWVLTGKGQIFLADNETGIDINAIKKAIELLQNAVKEQKN